MKQIIDLALYAPLHQTDGDSFVTRDVYGHLGTVTSALWTPAGRKFTGSGGRINCGSAAALDSLGTTGNYQFSIGAWVKPASYGQNNEGRIIDKTGSATRGFTLHVASTQSAQFNVRFGGGGIKQAIAPANTVAFGVWTFLFGVYNGANLLIYINRTLTTGSAATGAVDAHAADDFYIGNRSDNTRCFDGLIGEVMAYNRALTHPEVMRLYSETKWRYQ